MNRKAAKRWMIICIIGTVYCALCMAFGPVRVLDVVIGMAFSMFAMEASRMYTLLKQDRERA